MSVRRQALDEKQTNAPEILLVNSKIDCSGFQFYS
ncbi:Uncharacterised protein [Vibrio cholerae]|uniref:Uncharacterized protein n=1 Tax=Vibrio cholerae TaxID=666 RepID=A0A655XIM2_VIBCL|nr:Uncharacterised protein [Vibrio cholerae]